MEIRGSLTQIIQTLQKVGKFRVSESRWRCAGASGCILSFGETFLGQRCLAAAFTGGSMQP